MQHWVKNIYKHFNGTITYCTGPGTLCNKYITLTYPLHVYRPPVRYRAVRLHCCTFKIQSTLDIVRTTGTPKLADCRTNR